MLISIPFTITLSSGISTKAHYIATLCW